jgi:hypothetical protein
MYEMAAFTQRPEDGKLDGLLRWLASDPQTLMVFNHPLWDESEVGERRHRLNVEMFLSRYGATIHALELNGLRAWSENSLVAELAQAWNKPLVSGGDRHGLEPNAVVNLSGAASFSEFVDEIRRDGQSEILITAQYRQSLFWRMFDTVLDAVGDHERHGAGWKLWNERVFYTCDDGTVRSLKEIWGDRAPGVVRHFTTVARALHRSLLQRTLRAAMARPQEVVL